MFLTLIKRWTLRRRSESRSRLPGLLANRAALILAVIWFSACATVAVNSPRDATPGASRVIAAGEKELGFGRTYRLHVPPGVEPGDDNPRPLVVALHGGLASGRIFEKQTGFSRLADEQDFIVVYPNGIGILGLLRHWNAGWCCAKAMRSEVDDIGYIDRVVEQVADEWPVDRDRIYLVGYSNGGMLAHRYAAERSDKLAGLATFAGPAGLHDQSEWRENPARPPSSALPVLVVHGKSDRRLAVDGGEDRRGLRPLGAIESAAFWARRNACGEGISPITGALTGSAVDEVVLCSETETPVKVLLLDGWGHEWPGPRRTGRLPASHPLAGFDAARSIWSFFTDATM